MNDQTESRPYDLQKVLDELIDAYRGVSLVHAYLHEPENIDPSAPAPSERDVQFWDNLQAVLKDVKREDYVDVDDYFDDKLEVFFAFIQAHGRQVIQKPSKEIAASYSLEPLLRDIYRELQPTDMADLSQTVRGKIAHAIRKSVPPLWWPHPYIFSEMGVLDTDRQTRIIKGSKNFIDLFAEERNKAEQPAWVMHLKKSTLQDLTKAEREELLENLARLHAEAFGIDPPPIIKYSETSLEGRVGTTHESKIPAEITIRPDIFFSHPALLLALINHEGWHAAQVTDRSKFKSKQSLEPRPVSKNRSKASPDKYAINILDDKAVDDQLTPYDKILGREKEREGYIAGFAAFIAALQHPALYKGEDSIFADIDLSKPGLDLRVTIGKEIEKKVLGFSLPQLLGVSGTIKEAVHNAKPLDLAEAWEGIMTLRKLAKQPLNPPFYITQTLLASMPELVKRAQDAGDPMHNQCDFLITLLENHNVSAWFKAKAGLEFAASVSDFDEAPSESNAADKKGLRALKAFAELLPDDFSRHVIYEIARRKIRDVISQDERDRVDKILRDTINGVERKYNLPNNYKDEPLTCIRELLEKKIGKKFPTTVAEFFEEDATSLDSFGDAGEKPDLDLNAVSNYDAADSNSSLSDLTSVGEEEEEHDIEIIPKDEAIRTLRALAEPFSTDDARECLYEIARSAIEDMDKVSDEVVELIETTLRDAIDDKITYNQQRNEASSLAPLTIDPAIAPLVVGEGWDPAVTPSKDLWPKIRQQASLFTDPAKGKIAKELNAKRSSVSLEKPTDHFVGTVTFVGKKHAYLQKSSTQSASASTTVELQRLSKTFEGLANAKTDDIYLVNMNTKAAEKLTLEQATLITQSPVPTAELPRFQGEVVGISDPNDEGLRTLIVKPVKEIIVDDKSIGAPPVILTVKDKNQTYKINQPVSVMVMNGKASVREAEPQKNATPRTQPKKKV